MQLLKFFGTFFSIFAWINECFLTKFLVDFRNIFDWMVYTLLLACVITHTVDIVHHTLFVARLHIRIMAITVILIWLRLMKNARAFSALGESFYNCDGIRGEILTNADT